MGFEEINSAIQIRMGAWVGVPVAYDGIKNTADTQAVIDRKGRWVRLSINHGDSLVASISNQPETRRTGLIMVQVFTEDGEGSRPAATIADSLAEHLEYWRQGDLETRAASVQRIGPENGQYQYNVTVPFLAGC